MKRSAEHAQEARRSPATQSALNPQTDPLPDHLWARCLGRARVESDPVDAAATLAFELTSAQSKLYEEPKKLVANGLGRATDDSVGRRRRTCYTITAKGRRALARLGASPARARPSDSSSS